MAFNLLIQWEVFYFITRGRWNGKALPNPSLTGTRLSVYEQLINWLFISNRTVPPADLPLDAGSQATPHSDDVWAGVDFATNTLSSQTLPYVKTASGNDLNYWKNSVYWQFSLCTSFKKITWHFQNTRSSCSASSLMLESPMQHQCSANSRISTVTPSSRSWSSTWIKHWSKMCFMLCELLPFWFISSSWLFHL